MSSTETETKIIYHIGEEDTPYLIKLGIPPNVVTLKDLKDALGKPAHKYFFKSMDDDFGVVKEELIEDNSRLPCFNGRVVSWVVSPDASDTQSLAEDRVSGTLERQRNKDDRSNRLHSQSSDPLHNKLSSPIQADLEREALDRFDEDSCISSRRDHRRKDRLVKAAGRKNGVHNKHRRGYDTASTITSSDLESTSFFDSEDDCSSRYSTVTGDTSMSSKYGRHRPRRRKHIRMPNMSRASSFSSITDSTMSLNVITVTLNMDQVSFLGISIVGQSNPGGDGGIYVGSIMKGGAVALDGRIDPGDMILEVNGVSFENLSNDDAVRTLREAVQHPGPITLVVAKCWDPTPKGYFTIPRQEPVRPIDPSAWVAHTTALQQQSNLARGGPLAASMDTVSTITGSSLQSSSIPESQRGLINTHSAAPPGEHRLTVETPLQIIARTMALADSGLEIRDRMWLKISIPNAFIGSDLVDWLYRNVEGFGDRRDARKFANNMLKAGYIRHTVNKSNFSEQCYYVLGDLSDIMSGFSLSDIEIPDSISERAENTQHPGNLPPPHWNNTIYSGYSQFTSASQQPPNVSTGSGNYLPPPYSFVAGGMNGEQNQNAAYQNYGVTHPPPNASSQHSSGRCCCFEWIAQTYKLPRTGNVSITSSQKLLDEIIPPPVWWWDNLTCTSSTSSCSTFTSCQLNSCSQCEELAKLEDWTSTNHTTGSGSASGSNRSSSNRSSSKSKRTKEKDRGRSGSASHHTLSSSDTDSVVSQRRNTQHNESSERSFAMTDMTAQSLPPPPRELTGMNPEVSGSKQSFRQAMTNPMGQEFFVDVM